MKRFEYYLLVACMFVGFLLLGLEWKQAGGGVIIILSCIVVGAKVRNQ